MPFEPSIEICNQIGVCLECYHKVLIYLKKHKNDLCHICLQPAPDRDLADLLWIGDEQVVYCGRTSCGEDITKLDRLSEALRDGAKSGEATG